MNSPSWMSTQPQWYRARPIRWRGHSRAFSLRAPIPKDEDATGSHRAGGTLYRRPFPDRSERLNRSCFAEPFESTLPEAHGLGVNRIPITTQLGYTVNGRLKTLVVGLALVAVGVAGCSATSSSSSGAMQDDATSSAASSSAASSSPASSSPASPAASADPVASPIVASSSPSTTPPAAEMLGSSSMPTNNSVCNTGLQYACGGTGASGVGIVFYANSTAFPCGTNLSSTCNFLEAAPNGWNGEQVKCPTGCGGSDYNGIGGKTSDFGAAGAGAGTGSAYCSGMGEHNPIPNANSTAIGTGYQNTTAMVENCVPNNAGNAARAYSGGGMTDWSLASAGELAALRWAPNVQTIGGIAGGANYWSSTQASGSQNAWMMQFLNGIWNTNPKASSQGVRPVRAF
jgi:hypothetical protein